MNKDIIILHRQSKRRPQFWLKTIFSLGIWLLWWRNNYLALTSRSIIRREGVFTKKERAIPLSQVQDVSISYGIIRRILGHGDIRIETAGSGGTEIIMHNVDKPEEFRS
ncbi:MAG: PH domain-containing protein, partial [Anaerolineae bacterium]|nr:PH domain-containing protein [Anaerolineae bacterium]